MSFIDMTKINSSDLHIMAFNWGELLCPARSKTYVLNYLNLSHVVKNQCCAASSMQDKFKLPAQYETVGESVWVQYSQLAAKIKPAVNLAQGAVDFQPPEHVTKSLRDVVDEVNPSIHQYTRSFGHPRLVQVLSKIYSPLICREINPLTEILVTYGALVALNSAIVGLVNEGDEVIVIEPYFYEALVKLAKGVPRFIALKPKTTTDTLTSAEWVLDEEELESLFNPRTKMIILNTPHNPLGKVFTKKELELIANLCKKYNVLCLSDETYEWIVFGPNEHIRIASLPSMWERTITVSSVGKTFFITGWRTGWAYGPAAIMANMRMVHQNTVFACCTPIQEALARILEYELSRFGSPECYLHSLACQLLPKREFLVKTLRNLGFKPIVPEGGYFLMADWTRLANKIDLSSEHDKYKDYRFTKKFAKETSVLTIPPSTFYSEAHKHLGEDFVRFCFVKKDENLAKAVKLFKEWKVKKEKI